MSFTATPPPRATMRSSRPQRVFVLGATGTIGQATVTALVARGHDVVCFIRPRVGADGAQPLTGATLRFGAVTDPACLSRDGIRGERFDVITRCFEGTVLAAEATFRLHAQSQVRPMVGPEHKALFLEPGASAIGVPR